MRLTDRTPIALLVLALTASPGPAQEGAGAPAAQEVKRPAYSILRQNEDWSSLAGVDLEATGDPFDRIKYVPISEDGKVWASFGGSSRLRIEGWNDFNFGAPPTVDHDDVFTLWRALVHGDVHVGQNLRFFAEVKSALATDRDLLGGTRPIDEDDFDLQQLFADASFDLGADSRLTVRPGRQMLLFGKQRLVSPLPWANALRTWDGVSAVLKTAEWRFTGFLTQFVPVDIDHFNEPDHDEDFLGLYATTELESLPASAEFYWLSRNRDAVAFNGTAGDEERDTLGARLYGKAHEDRLDWDVEGAVQTGEIGAADVSGAFMLGSQVGWKLPDAPGKPRAWIGLDYASGDDEAGGDVETFDQLYPLAHLYFGQADVIGRQNIFDASAGATWQVMDDVTLDLENHAFWLADEDDALYNAGGGATFPGGSADSTFVGYELDLRAGWKLGRHYKLECGYSHVFAGDAVEDAGPGEDIDFAYAGIEMWF